MSSGEGCPHSPHNWPHPLLTFASITQCQAWLNSLPRGFVLFLKLSCQASSILARSAASLKKKSICSWWRRRDFCHCDSAAIMLLSRQFLRMFQKRSCASLVWKLSNPTVARTLVHGGRDLGSRSRNTLRTGVRTSGSQLLWQSRPTLKIWVTVFCASGWKV